MSLSSSSSSQSLSSLFTYISSLYSYLKGAIVASTGLAVLLSALLYFKQSELIYPRSLPPGARTTVPTPDQFGVQDWETVALETPDGETLSNFLLKSSRRPRPGATVLFMHGNAGNIGHRLPIARVFSEQMGCNIFILSYRGYGFSTGRPSEKGLLIDAQTALTYLLSNESTRNTRLFVYGQSLGGALAIQLVARNQDKVQGLILENTFRSIRTLIPTVFPPARYLVRLCNQIWPSEKTLPRISSVPVLFLSGQKDELVPPSHMKQLYNVCNSPVKVWKELPNGTHNDTCAEDGYFDYIDEFIEGAMPNGKLAMARGAAASTGLDIKRSGDGRVSE
ncbi:bem46 protein, variant [Maublancomyces gigas]|uniref:Bem46 protein, variant n=1 Tax=Discina gigas TaxID=1032678 RepID=A0ABR3G7K1_9PEZI